MKKLILTSFPTKIALLTGIVMGFNFIAPKNTLAQTFQPTWQVIEISQGPFSENLEASQVFSTALSYYYAGNLKYAALAFQKAITYDPNMDEAYYLLANSLYQVGRLEDAAIQYQKAIEVNPFFPKSHNNLGTIFASQKKYEEAIAEYDKALEIDPNFAIAIYNKGIAMLQSNDTQEGLLLLQTAKQLFKRAGDDDNAYKVEQYLECGIGLISATPNTKRSSICQY